MGKKDHKECPGGEKCYEDRHLCKLIKKNEPDQIRDLIKDARFFCRKCGRSAHDSGNLCKPINI